MSRNSRVRDADYGRDERRPRVVDDSSLDSRVYIGGINSKSISYREVDSWMSKYGKVDDVAFCDRHILVQFDRESDATKAIDREQGQTYRGTRFDIRFAHSSDGAMSRSEIPRSKSPRNASYERDPRDISPRRDAVRDRSPEDRDRYYKERRPHSPDYRNYERPRNPIDERSRGIIDERKSIDERSRSNNRQEYVNNDIQDPNWNGISTENKVVTDRPSFDTAIVVMSSDLLNYAESIELKLQSQIALSTHIIVLKEEAHANACIDDLEKKGVLYAFLVNQMNEKHKSCTLRILHGTGQEHRNMLLNNALTFVAHNYEEYQKQHRDLKSIATKANYDPSRMPPGFLAPDDKIIYQLHLLADSRMLTTDELNEVDEFIQKRIQILAEAEGIVEKPNAITNMTSKDMNQQSIVNIRDDNSKNALTSKLTHMLKPGQSQMSNNLSSKDLNVPSAMHDSYGNYNDLSGTCALSNPLQNTKVQQALDTLMQSKFRPPTMQDQVQPDELCYSANVVGHQYMSGGMARAPNPMAVPMVRGGMQSAGMVPVGQNMYGSVPYQGYYQQQPQQQQQLVQQAMPMSGMQQQQAPLGQPMYRPRQQFQPGRTPHYPGY